MADPKFKLFLAHPTQDVSATSSTFPLEREAAQALDSTPARGKSLRSALASGSADETLKVWDVAAGTCAHTRLGPGDESHRCPFWLVW